MLRGRSLLLWFQLVLLRFRCRIGARVFLRQGPVRIPSGSRQGLVRVSSENLFNFPVYGLLFLPRKACHFRSSIANSLVSTLLLPVRLTKALNESGPSRALEAAPRDFSLAR